MESSTASGIAIRPVNEMDADDIVHIDEKISGKYRPGHWENQITYYIQRDTELALVAETEGEVVGFMFGDLRGWEFGFENPVGWVEVIGVHPDHRKKNIGRSLAERLFKAFKDRGAAKVLTLVDSNHEGIANFMKTLGLAASTITVYSTDL